MSELFILGRMRANFETVRGEVEAFEKRFALDPDAKLCIGDIALIPVPISLLPEHLRERWAEELDRGLFTDYAIGTLCGSVYGAAWSNTIDRFKEQTYTYGTRSRVIREKWTPYEGWFDAADDQLSQEEVDDEEDEDSIDGDEPVDDYWSQPPQYRERVEAEFRTDHILRWCLERDALMRSVGIGAKLIIVNTRDAYARYEDGDGGRKLMQLLGPTAATVIRGERVACLAVRTDEPSHEMFKRIRPGLRPRQVEDFLMFDIGQDVAPFRAGLSKLEDWVQRLIVRREVVEAEELFRHRRRAS